MIIKHIDRYGTCTDEYVHYIHYENGDIEQHGTYESLPKEAQTFVSSSEKFEFRKSKNGEFYHRFS